MKSAFLKFKYATTGRWSISLASYLFILPILFLYAMERENLLNEKAYQENILVVAAGELSGALFIFLAQATILRNRKVRLQPLVLVVLVWTLTGVTRGLIAGLYSQWAFGLKWFLPERVVSSILTSILFMALIAFYVGSVERRKVEAQALQALNNFLRQDEEILIENDSQERSKFRETYDHFLKPLAAALDDILRTIKVSSGNPEIHAGLKRLQKANQELQVEIELEKELQNKVEKVTLNTSIPNSLSYISSLVPKNLSVRTTFLFLLAGGIVSQFFRNGLSGILLATGNSAVMAFIAFLFSRPSKLSLGIFTKLSYPITYLAIFFGQMTIQYLFVANYVVLPHPYPAWYISINTLAGFYFACIFSSLNIETESNRENLVDESLERRSTISKIIEGSEIISAKNQIIRFGKISGKISSVIMVLKMFEIEEEKQLPIKLRQDYLNSAESLIKEAQAGITAIESSN